MIFLTDDAFLGLDYVGGRGSLQPSPPRGGEPPQPGPTGEALGSDPQADRLRDQGQAGDNAGRAHRKEGVCVYDSIFFVHRKGQPILSLGVDALLKEHVLPCKMSSVHVQGRCNSSVLPWVSVRPPIQKAE